MWLLCLLLAIQGNLKVSLIIFIINFLTIIIYYYTLWQTWLFNEKSYNTNSLFWIVFIFSFFFVFIYKIIYYDNHGDFFSINALDAINYHKIAIKNADSSIFTNLKYYIREYNYSDIGALLFIGIIYKLIPSTLFLDFINIIIGALSAVALFKIARFFMSRKYSFMCAIAYTCSSFVVQFESSGLKEPLFSYILLMCFLFFLKYINNKWIGHFLFFCIFAILILLFRPVILGFLLISISIGLLALNRKRKTNFLFIVFIFIAIIYTVSSYTVLFHTYSSFDKSISFRSDATKMAGENIAIYAAVISGIFGPLPTLIPTAGKEISSIYSSGLLFRVILSVPFCLSITHIIKKRIYLLYPFMIMVILELGALIFIMESYELRYHLLHLPFVFLLAFYYLFYIDKSDKSHKAKVYKTLNYSIIVLFILVLYWNWRLL